MVVRTVTFVAGAKVGDTSPGKLWTSIGGTLPCDGVHGPHTVRPTPFLAWNS